MADNSKLQLPSDEQVKTFLALKTHEEKCAHFNKPENANLALIFRGLHFPKPEAVDGGTV